MNSKSIRRYQDSSAETKTYWVNLPWAKYAVTIDSSDVVVHTAPIADWMIGKDWLFCEAWLAKRNARIRS